METDSLYDSIREKFSNIIAKKKIESDIISIRAVPLSPQEAIGNPEDKDYPLITGMERIMQAEFRGSFGHAFTDMYGDYVGSLKNILCTELKNNYRRAIFVAALNAVMKHLGMITKSVHCKNEEPKDCALALNQYIEKKYGCPKIAFVGFQPRMIENLSKKFELKVTDLAQDNIGTNRFGVAVQGQDMTGKNLDWCDLALVTGTTLVNATIGQFLINKPVIFYGVTISGAAKILSLENFCYCGH